MVTSTVATYLGAAAFSAGLGLAVLAGAGVAAADADDTGASQSSSSESATDTGVKTRTEKSERPSSRASEDSDAPETVAEDDNSDSATETSEDEAASSDVDADSDREDDELEDAAEATVEDESDALIESADPVVAEPVSTEPVETTAATLSAPAAPAVAEENFFTWLTREIDYFFWNRKPTAKPLQMVQSPTKAVVLGTLNATDREGDPLAYRVVTDPTNGSVTVDSNGTFVYTPNAQFAAMGGTDVFTVRVTDIGWGLHLFTGGRRTYVPVAVTVKPPVDEPQYTRGFNVYNLTGSTLTYLGTQFGDVESAPAVGTRFDPGTSVHFELTYYFFVDNGATASFVSDAGQLFYASMGVLSPSGTSTASCATGGAPSACAPVKEEWTNDIVFMDAPGTVIEIPAGQGQKQAEVLDRLCYDGAPATCNFTPKYQVNDFTSLHQVGNSVTNSTPSKVVYTFTSSDTQTYSDSVSVSAKVSAKLGPIVNAELSATYGHTWQYAHTFTQAISVEVLPGTTFWIEARQPIFRVYGDLVLQAGNTTWILRDVYFESPNPSGNGNWEVLCAPSDTCSVQSGGAALDSAPALSAAPAARRVGE